MRDVIVEVIFEKDKNKFNVYVKKGIIMSKDYLETQKEYLVSLGERPWGYYLVLANELDFKVKKVVVKPGKSLSLQRHNLREEHWFIQKGKAIVVSAGQDQILEQGDSIDIPRNTIHRISNYGDSDLVFIEVQTGDYFGEDDIERIEDDNGRAE